MAEIRSPAASLPVQIGRALQPTRVEAAREAQRAFFNAALAGDAPAGRTSPVPPATQATVRTTVAGPDPRLRPGSIVDIKV